MPTATQPRTPHPPDLLAPLRQAIHCLAGTGVDLFRRVQAALAQNTGEYLPKAYARSFARAPKIAERRVERANLWLGALIRTLTGDRDYLRRFAPIRPAGTAAAPLISPPGRSSPSAPRRRTDATRELEQRGRIRRALTTQPIGRIARRICRDLAIRPGHESWPTALIDLAETPERWADRIAAADAAYEASTAAAPPEIPHPPEASPAPPSPAPPTPAPPTRRPPPPS